MTFLDTPLHYLPNVSTKRATALADDLGLRTYRDLLYFPPLRYIDRRYIHSIAHINSTMPHTQVCGIIREIRIEGQGRKQQLTAILDDGTGYLRLIWFRGIEYVLKILVEGKKYIVFGKPQLYGRKLQMPHPEIRSEEQPAPSTGRYQAVYSSSEKLKRTHIDSAFIENLIDHILCAPQFLVHEPLSQLLVDYRQLAPIELALRWLHQPYDPDQIRAAKYRLKYDELFYLNLNMRRKALSAKQRFRGHLFTQVGPLFNGLYHQLPYDLTNAQKRVLREIRRDTRSGAQMNRLLQGDVGSGKTLVALLAMLLAVDNGLQACLLAPTEILAQQHFETLSTLLSRLDVSIALHTGSSKIRQRRNTLQGLAEGEINILVGTHAILEEQVIFQSLGIAVIDEQHRFGVAQRSKLWSKNIATLPHILVMSATPIPRTLAMTVYGDLDVSIIDELPPGRKPISTTHVPERLIDSVYQQISEAIDRHEQVYVVFPMIEGSEESDFKNLEVGWSEYTHMFGEQRVAYVHGRLSPEDKAEQMARFVSGEVPILLATTVIEVGVNVPSATIMVINDAHRFGLSQLHQLRGRVGRGGDKSYCILVTPNELKGDAERRIEIMVATQDGFKIAEEDMRLRGFGQMEGTQQSGTLVGITFADPVSDYDLLALTRYDATTLLQHAPDLDRADLEVFRIELDRRYPDAQSWCNIS